MITKQYLISFWLSILLGIFLFYRNYQYDRVVSIYCIFLAINNLFLYGNRNQANCSQVAKSLIVCTGIQALVLSLAVYFSLPSPSGMLNTVTGYWVIFSFIFLIALLFYVCSDRSFSMSDDQIMVDGKPLNAGIKIVYLISCLGSLLLLSYPIWKFSYLTVFNLLWLAVCLLSFQNLIASLSAMSVIFLMTAWISGQALVNK